METPPPPPFGDGPLEDFTEALGEPSLSPLEEVAKVDLGFDARGRFEVFPVAPAEPPPPPVDMTSRSWASNFFRRVSSLRGKFSSEREGLSESPDGYERYFVEWTYLRHFKLVTERERRGGGVSLHTYAEDGEDKNVSTQ